MTTPPPEVTRLLAAWRQGDEAALDELFPLVYDELRRIARRHLRHERAGHTLQTTALVHEAYLRLAGREEGAWESRAHFFAFAARVMRHLLVDHARRDLAVRHGGGALRVTLGEAAGVSAEPGGAAVDVLALDEALARLAALDERKCRLVELRYFGGLSAEETAAALGVSEITVKREWLKAKAWLYRELSGG
jgi:RNA polymerase sigma factor (TIGR02999 family)